MPTTRPVEILLVEDSFADVRLTLRALRRVLVSDAVEVVRDGAEALEFLFCEGIYTERFAQPKPNLVLLDLKLPKVDGLEVLRRVKGDARTSSIPVVMFTSSREQQDVIRSYALGVNSFVVKPVDFENFQGAVEKVGNYWLRLNHSPEVRE